MAVLKTWKMKDGDIVFSAGQFVWIYDNDAVLQRLENRLKLWLNEVRNLRVKTLAEQGQNVVGTTAGIDYLDIFNGVYSQERIEDIFRSDLLNDEFVTSVDTLTVEVNRGQRVLTVNFEVTSAIDGETITGSI